MAATFDEPAWRLVEDSAADLSVGYLHYEGERDVAALAANERRVVASAGNVLWVEDTLGGHLSRRALNERLLALADASEDAPFDQAVAGRFAVVSLDRRSGKLRLGGDRHAMYALYYVVEDGVVYFATRVAALLAALDRRPAFDVDAIADYLAHKHFIAQRTWFEGLRMPPEGGYVEFEGGVARERRYWSYRLAESNEEALAPREADRRLRAAWNHSLDACASFGERCGVALSGGLDSRAIAGALVARGKRVMTYTFGDPNCNDIKFARRVADHLRVPQLTTSLEAGSYILRDHALIVRRTDGMLPLNHSHPAALLPFVGDTADTLFDGLTGKVLGSVRQHHHGARPLGAGGGTEALRKHFRLYDDEKVLGLMPGARPFAQRAASYGLYYSDFGHKLAGSAVAVFSCTSRQRRFVSQQPRVLEGDKRVLCPFWVNDYADTCFRLSPSDRRYARPWVQLNRDEFPALSRIPWTHTGLPLWVPNKLAYQFINVNDGLSYANYFVKRFLKVGLPGDYQAGFSFYFDWYRNNPALRGFLYEVLTDPSVARIPFLDATAVRAALDAHMDNLVVNHTDLLGTLAALVLYFQAEGLAGGQG